MTTPVKSIPKNGSGQSPKATRIDIYVVRRAIGQVFRYFVLVGISLIFILPFILAFLGGFKANSEIFAFPPSVFPEGWTEEGRFEPQTFQRDWQLDDDWQLNVQHNQFVERDTILAYDEDGNVATTEIDENVYALRAFFEGTSEIRYRLIVNNDWDVRVNIGQEVKAGDVLAVDTEGNEFTVTVDGVIAFLGISYPCDRECRRNAQDAVLNRTFLNVGDVILVTAEGETIRANFPATIYYDEFSQEERLELASLRLKTEYKPRGHTIGDTFGNDETYFKPEEELFRTTRDLYEFRETQPFDIQYEVRSDWAAREQYGAYNWVRVFISAEACEDRWLGPYCFPYWLWNSVFIAGLNVMTRVFFAILAGYAFARMSFPGKNIVFTFMLATLFIPGAVTLIPGYVLIADIGWVGSHWALVLPSLVEVFGIFLMTQFLKAVPRDLEEAARVDGATQWQIVWQVVIPLARPAIITLAILAFQGSWNAFQGPLLYLRGDPGVYTLTVGLQYFQQAFRQEWNSILIGSMFNAVPVLVIFLFFNRYFIEGVSYSGVKG